MTPAHKPVRRKVEVRAPHGVSPQIAVTIYPNGTIGLREFRRRNEHTLEIGELYVYAVRSAVARAERLARQYRKNGLTRAQARATARKECHL